MLQTYQPSPRFFAAFLISALLVTAAAKKTVATAKGENQDVIITATIYVTPADVKELIGNDLGGHYIVAEVKMEPKFGKDLVIDRDDFQLRTDKDGDKAKPFAASQIAGSDPLVVKVTSNNQGVGSPGWSGSTAAVIIGGGASKKDKDADKDKDKDKDKAAPKPADPPEKLNPLKKMLDSKILPEGKTSQPVSGLLYFPMEKQKMKDLEVTYGGKENRISFRFKP